MLFRSGVQSRINQLSPDFSVLLGDNIYEWGSHLEADSRFDPEVSRVATDWISGHIDYFGIGNHDTALGSHAGEASQDSYSVPMPIAGVNAHVSPPPGEVLEFNHSFDYGNVHFVTFDSNPVEATAGDEGPGRLIDLLDFVVEDLLASSAQWKVVYTHHPIAGTEKPYDDPNGFYFQHALPRLREAGADLLLVGDSHTYSWTHALTGSEDANNDGRIDAAEVDYVASENGRFTKNAGLIQVVAGVGGRSLRSNPYTDPYIAAGYSTNEGTGPIEFGFAQIDVTQDRMTVSYISAASGQIVGDTNRNGLPDPDEPYFARFQIVDPNVHRGDLDDDGSLDVQDLDLLCAAIINGEDDRRFDINGDLSVDLSDHDMMVSSIIDTLPGDATVDRVFNSQDLVQVLARGKYETGDSATWAEGDWNCDGRFDANDLITAMLKGRYRV